MSIIAASTSARLVSATDRAIERLRVHFAALFALVMLTGVASSLAWAGGARMFLPGAFDVNASGAGNYSIPIVVPPGTAGMAPTLTLDYSSGDGNGLLGLGWSLGGLPSVGRCAQTVATDGVRGSVNYNTNDRFCLDGQRQEISPGFEDHAGPGRQSED